MVIINAITVKNILFGYNKKDVLRDITFDVLEGEFLSIIGPNGSGKSTLLKTLNHIFIPKSGQILIKDLPIENYKKKDLAKYMAMVPQDTNVDFEFRVEEVVAMGRHPFQKRFQQETKEDKDIIYQSMELTNTLEIRNRYINEISGGERQRVFIAKALAQKPSIILLDEPTSHLDINHQMDILNLLKRLNEENGITVVLVIHDINLASRYSDRILLLDSGEVIGLGNPEEVISIENIEKSYGMNVAIERNKYTDHIYLTPIEIKHRIKDKKYYNIHIISGGGTGQELINRLYGEGHSLSLGVLNVGDSDWQHGRSLRIEIVEEKPFSSISDKSYKKALDKVKESDIVIMTNVPIGSGNLLNLKLAERSIELGKKIIYYEEDHYENFDFTNGEATTILDSMKAKGIKVIKNIDDIIEELK